MQITEHIWHDSRTDTMILTDPGHGKGPYQVDAAREAADFWNANKNAAGCMLRDPYNGHYWTTAEARGNFLASIKTAAAPVMATIALIPPSRTTAPLANIQLWEPCEKCGAEPSYLTAYGHLCKNC